MRPHIDLRFRPSLVLFIDETGALICEQLRSIMHFTGFDPVLCESVALLLVDSASQSATRVDLGKTPSDDQTEQEKETLSALIESALRDVQDDLHIQHITAAGYPMPNTRTQIFIVGDAHSPELARVLETVYNRLLKAGLTTLVCYVINAFRQRQITGSLTDSLLEDAEEPEEPDGLDFAIERNLPGFCYLYEDKLNYPTPAFVSKQASYYATAEAIFALIATSLTTEPFFATQMQIGAPLGRYENVGSLSTSLIVFPRISILEFCSARLGIILMEQWHQDLRNQHTSNDELDRLQERARRRVEDIREWIKDSARRPLTDSLKKHTNLRQEENAEDALLCPTLHILLRVTPPQKGDIITDEVSQAEQQRQDYHQHRMYRNLQEETEKLFLLFWPDDINEEYRQRRRRFANWTRLVLQRGNRAVQAWNDWDKRATRAWNRAADRINTEIKEFIDYLWSRDQNGFDVATIYVNELDEQIASLYNDLSNWRVEHEESYQQFLTLFELMAENGAWATPNTLLNGPAGNATAQAHPTMRGVNQDSSTATDGTSAGNAGNILGINPTPTQSASLHLPAREERIVQNLEQRITWHQDRIPAIPTQIVVAIPFILALVLSFFALFPWIPRTALDITIASVLASILIGSIHWMFRLRYILRVEECKEDLLIFYRRYYAHRCELSEDKLRRNVLGPLRRKVQAINERLNNLQQFVQEARQTLDEQARRVQEELFNSPAGLRDIFVANGERLQRIQRNTLADFAAQISKLRIKEPLEEWHRSAANLKRQLIQNFRQQSESLMEMSDEETLEQIRAFASNVTSPYLKGPLVELQTALDKPDIWMEALERAENPLYQAQVGTKEPKFSFICGRDFDIDRGVPYIPNDAYPVRISDTQEWVLLAAFFRGGLPTTINPDILFPEKSALTASLTGDDNETNNTEDVPQYSTVNGDDDSLS